MNQQSLEQINTLGSLLELLPYAAILLDINSQQIRIANSRISELALYTRAEFIDMPASHLFLNWDQEFIHKLIQHPDSESKASAKRWQISKDLSRRNELSVPVRLIYGPVYIPLESILILIVPKSNGQTDLEDEYIHQFWQGTSILIDALQENKFRNALEKILQAGKTISGAELLAVYQAHGKKPLLKRQVSLGPAKMFPEQLSAQDFIQLKKPLKWIAGKGKRPTGQLYRTAHSAKFSYICSAPLGQPNAMIGLIVIGDTNKNPAENVSKTTQFLGEIITALIQKHIWMSRTRKELSSQEKQLRISATLKEQTHEGVLLLESNLRIQSLNISAELILGYANSEVSGQPAEKVLIGTKSLLPSLTAAQTGTATYNLGTLHLYRRNGDEFLALVRIFPVMNGNKVEKILIFIQDLSEQEEIRIQAQQLEQRALLGEVTAIFAHEIRNPINNISTGLQVTAMNMPKDDPNREPIDRMMMDCDRLTELIKSVLAYSRPTDYEMQALDIGILIKRLLDRLHPRITHLNVISKLEVEPDCQKIFGNARALEQVFNNLITNSLQAMDKNGGNLAIKIRKVETPEGDTCIEVRIADTGPGIPDEIKHRIFLPFFTTKDHGTGLGLAISKRIVSAHKGIINLESFPGGTIFSIQLPIARSNL